MDNQGLRSFFCVEKVALKSKRKCRLDWNLLLFRYFLFCPVYNYSRVCNVVSAMKCGFFGEFASGKESKNLGTVIKLPWRINPTLVSSWFLLYIKLLLFFSTKQCTYTYKPFSLSYLQVLWMNFLTS